MDFFTGLVFIVALLMLLLLVLLLLLPSVGVKWQMSQSHIPSQTQESQEYDLESVNNFF